MDTAAAIRAELAALPVRDTSSMRAVRRRWSRTLKAASGSEMLETALALHRTGPRWIAEELIRHHPAAFARIGDAEVEAMAQGLDSWGAVDAFGTILAGPAWAAGQVSDDVIWGWARSPDRWLRRTALVCTTALGRADAERALALCQALAADRDAMVEKALSWALRALAMRDRAAVEAFLDAHAESLAARVRREVGNKLRTGLKTPKSSPAGGGGPRSGGGGSRRPTRRA
ncbi:DNA alkylation repair protein [Phenylobacterium terrae]|uniref:DNA alkylation repair protein n=1 Tax=Phenylobacterium terrae TaxID=2665495 RepID=A0ABW4N319_9CAUL